jgi:hypothetical protein
MRSGDPLDECLQLLRARRTDASKDRGASAREVGTVEEQHVEVNVQVERRAEALDQRHRACFARRACEARFPQDVTGDLSVHDPKDLRERLGIRREQEP